MISSFQTVILKDLFKNRNGLLDFTLYSRYKLSVKDLLISLNGLKEMEFISEVEDRILLTEKGFDYMVYHRRLPTVEQKDSAVLAAYKQPALGINEFYIPRLPVDKSKK